MRSACGMCTRMSAPPPGLIALIGPTATGKTALAVRLALRLGAAELVNADSRQVLRGLRVGTNAPAPEELSGVACHLLGIVDPGEPFSVADWAGAARERLAEMGERGVRPILVGGTGLYVRALLDGFDLSGPAPDPSRRRALATAASTPEGLATLGEELRRRDPAGAERTDLRNPRRVVRALETIERHGSLAGRPAPLPSLPALRIGLDAPRPLHDRWIADRARLMLEGGLLEETRAALERGVARDALAAAGIGYREALAVLDGALTPVEAAGEIARRTRRYAKAQRTWFRAEPGVVWLRREADGDLDAIAARVLEVAGRTGAPPP